MLCNYNGQMRMKDELSGQFYLALIDSIISFNLI